jgi:hypothetical protein
MAAPEFARDEQQVYALLVVVALALEDVTHHREGSVLLSQNEVDESEGALDEETVEGVDIDQEGQGIRGAAQGGEPQGPEEDWHVLDYEGQNNPALSDEAY